MKATPASKRIKPGSLSAEECGNALDVLEFRRVLEHVAARAGSDMGRMEVLRLRPSGDVLEVRKELARVGAAMRFLSNRPGWAVPPIPDIANRLAALRVDGAVLDASTVRQVSVALASSRMVHGNLGGNAVAAGLATVEARLVSLPELERELNHAVSPEGEVLDRASVELRRVRSGIRRTRERIVRRMEKLAAALPRRIAVPDSSVSLRHGRYVIPVRREGKGEVGGIIHDESRSGATLFVEPPAAIAPTNELRALEKAEEREIRKILAQLSGRIAPRAHELMGALDALIDLDSLCARALTAKAWRGTLPDVTDVDVDANLVVTDARHPLLVEAGRGGGSMPGGTTAVVPFDFCLQEDERAVIVSGPNAGGKSVFLRATGLACVLAQSGVVPPVGVGTKLPAFGSFYADMGDGQSIAHSLSTYSAHLANMAEILANANSGSLVLLDELGTGTDPIEGAALARAAVEELVGRGATVVASSHLGELKRLDTEESGIANASLEFDEERMRPTFRLVKGRPGRSYGLALARRAALPVQVIDQAESYAGEDEVKLDGLLATLSARERESARVQGELDAERRRLAAHGAELARREEEAVARERSAQSAARRATRDFLLRARTEVEDTISELTRAARERSDLREAAAVARRRVESAAKKHDGGGHADSEGPDRLPPGMVPLRAAELATLQPGNDVFLRANGARGRVRSVRADRVVVEVGGLRLNLLSTELARPEPAADPRSPEEAS